MRESLITLDNLSIGYNNQPVLRGISLAIARASFTSILGANGSGKSTMLKTLLGLIPPLAGRIRFAVDGDAPLVFGYVPQSFDLDPLYPFTGFDVALMGAFGRLRPGRFVPHNERTFTHQCLAAAGADGFAQKRFAELSGGQKQRVLIARALVTRPDVLVLDEPTAGVDAVATHAVLEFISKIHDEKKITILLVTHDLPIVREHAQEVIWLHQGRVLHGTVNELLSPEHMAEVFEMEL
ncbi:MAG TPA: metal ABC transporter ATP-binding protein [Verrucomicrobiae bacterium]|nr:metal ABC transporter ATP-binding protein [Verrucomicrobiae bacterium]